MAAAFYRKDVGPLPSTDQGARVIPPAAMRDVDLDTAAEILRAGGLVAFPTETVYGLGADASSPTAVAKIFAAKGRPTSHPLIVHLLSADDVEGWAQEVPPAARRLADVLWPGPLTLVFQRGPRASDAVTGGLGTIALRVPSHPIARALLARFGGGIAAPSANRFGSVSPTTADHVRRELADRVEALLDGGPSDVGLESTIVDVSQGVPSILRPGGVSRETLEAVLGAPVPLAGEDAPRAPGTLASHYAPRARVVAVRADEAEERAREIAVAHPGEPIAVLSPAEIDVPGVTWVPVAEALAERARSLYASLRALDDAGFARALIVLPEDERGLGLAIADRVRRAAGPRDPG